MKMTLEEMKNDANWPDFAAVPEEVMEYAHRTADNHKQFCTWFYLIGEEVYSRTWAYIETKKRGFEIIEVERYGTNCPKGWTIQKNMYYVGMAGWQVVFSKAVKDKYFGYYDCATYWADDFNKWGHEKRAGVWRALLNTDEIFKNEHFKHCGWSGKDDVIDYIRLWKKDPAVEYFGKLGLKYSKLLANKAKKDKQFVRFLRDTENIDQYSPTTIVRAYKDHISLEIAEGVLMLERTAERELRDLYQRKVIKPDCYRIWNYIEENEIKLREYEDYWMACVELGMDMKDTKNLYPNDFKRMHDLRTSEYASYKAKKKAEKSKELTRRIRQEAEKWQQYETISDQFSIIFARSVKDMVHEGDCLHHCVGRMGYDVKMAEGISLIAFLRKTEDVKEPYVTIEYSPSEKKIRQIYGDHDSKPAPEVIEFAESWAKRISKDLRRKA